MRYTAATWRVDASRDGFSLAELITSLAVAALLAALLFGVLLAQLKVARTMAERAEHNAAVRTAVAVVGGETRRALPSDVRALSDDSLAMRLFRGVAIPCAAAAGGVVVRYRGDRMPDSRKDSVLVVDAALRRLALLDARPAAAGACADREGETLQEWRLDGTTDGAAALLVFESGRYFLTNRALRYRLGGEGRQPLTAEAFRDAGTAFLPDGAAHAIRFILDSGGGGRLQTHAASFTPSPHH